MAFCFECLSVRENYNFLASEFRTQQKYLWVVNTAFSYVFVVFIPAYTQIQPHSLVQQHKQQQQFVVHQSQGSQRTAGQLLQTASIQPSQHPVPVLPKPAPHQPSTPSQQATIFHSTISPHALHSSLNHAKAQPVQLTAINLQIQPTVSTVAHIDVLNKSALVETNLCQH